MAVAGLLFVAKAHADDSRKRASELFTDGEARFRTGDYAGAATAFDEANRLSPHPNIFWNLARSLERAGDSARAANAYHAYLQSEGAIPDRAAAAQSLARLAKQLGRLELHPPDAQPAVLVDGARVTAPVHFVSPGSHTVVMSAQGREQSQTVNVDAGGTRSVSPLPVAIATEERPIVPPPQSPPAVLPSPDRTSHGVVSPLVFFAGAGLTLVATGFAVGFGIDTNNERERFDASPSRATFDSGRDKQLRTNVAIGAAAGLGALTAITGLWLVDWKPKGTTTHVGAGPTSIEFGGSFM